MKKSMLIAAMVALVAAPSLAGDGIVSKSKLRSLGLGQMAAMSDAQGMQVRGMSSSASATAVQQFSISIFLSDPVGSTSASFNGAGFGRGTAENAGLMILSTAGTFAAPVSASAGHGAFTTTIGTSTGSFSAFPAAGNLSQGFGSGQ